MEYLMSVRTRSYNAIVQRIKKDTVKLEGLQSSFILKKPSHIYEIKEQKLDMIIDRLHLSIKNILDQNRVRLFQSSNSYVLENPQVLYQFKEQYLGKLIEKLEVLNPMNTLKRGYAIAKSEGKVVSDIGKLKKGMSLTVELRDGIIDTKIEKVGKK